MDLKAVLSGDEESFEYGSGWILPDQIGSNPAGTGEAENNPTQYYRDAPTHLDMGRAHAEFLEELEVSGVVTTVTVNEANRMGWTRGMRHGGHSGQFVITRAVHALQHAFVKVLRLGKAYYRPSSAEMVWPGCTAGEQT